MDQVHLFGVAANGKAREEIALAEGVMVGARRWPCSASHPDAWERPLVGVVLSPTSPRAWTGTLAFPKKPSQRAVQVHVAQCRSRGLLNDVVPVLWTFSGQETVYWEPKAALKSPEEDRAEWVAARQQASAHLGRWDARLAA